MDIEWFSDGFFPREPEIPSRIMHKIWIYADSSDEEDLDVDYEKVGKWMLFLDNAYKNEVTGLTRHDYVWQFIKKLAESDILYSAKCSTSLEGVYVPDREGQYGVTCCYTKDYTNKQDVKRAADAIRGVVHLPFDLFYKTDNATRAGIYCHKGYKYVTIYKHTMERKMYERDPVTEYQWNLVDV
ncbi:unnamed protein product [Larinioides sclopetarius]|uniref:Uncharacterized protein n=1 Tax=Larinioides sclopetarius TaxID=280406 RepID=A0AAV1YUP5_9ARAC